MKRLFTSPIWIALALCCGGNPVPAADFIPFSLPWNDDQVNFSSVLQDSNRDIPAGSHGFIRVENGHLVDGTGKRIRFLGVNLAFSGNYPTHDQADAVSGHMAKYGINCVRFHHTDTLRAPQGIWKEGTSDKQTLDPVNLDRMDYFIHALKQKGIYVDLNLKIGREVIAGDGFTDVDRLPTYDKGPDHYVPRMIELQKNYARDLLTHLNPYTGNRYVDEPAVAIVEINNESGLVSQWAGSDLDTIPESYIQPLQTDWNVFLKEKYQTTEVLLQSWAPQHIGSEEEQFTKGLQGWTFQQILPAQGTKSLTQEGPQGEETLKLTITATSEQSWHAQAFYRDLHVKQGGYYKVKFILRAIPERQVSIGIKMDRDPWSNLDDYRTISLTSEWKTISLAFSPTSDESQARLDITSLANQSGTIWIANPSMIDSNPETLPDDQSVEAANISWIPRQEFSQRVLPTRQDWIDFLIERESRYYRDMNAFLKNELQLKAPIVGTQLGFGTAISQLENDIIDIHGYWNHPSFPNRPWDSVDWIETNQSIAPAENNTLERLMMARIEGKPFICTEYNHPAPMTYSSEGIPLLAAYAALQDWDGIFIYSYSHNNDYAGHSINNFFDICGHTPKMMTLPVAKNLFVRGDIASAQQTVRLSLSKKQYNEQILHYKGSLWFNLMKDMGIRGTAPYLHQTRVQFSDPPSTIENPEIQSGRVHMQSDTQELIWNQEPESQAGITIRSPKTKGYIGFVGGQSFDLGDGIRLEIGTTSQDWVNVLLTYQGENEQGHQWLLVATGNHENTGMIWKNEEKNSVGNQWGSGPPLVEPIPFRLTISTDIPNGNNNQTDTAIEFHSLNELAEPEKDLNSLIKVENEKITIDLMDSPQGLWYQIVFPKDNSMNSVSPSKFF